MIIAVMLSSGETDTWTDATDATIENGGLHVIDECTEKNCTEEDLESGAVKTLRTMEAVDRGPDLPPGERIRTHLIRATYAPGMWMKVEYR